LPYIIFVTLNMTV